MTDNGGGRDSWQENADSWFRPSENRHRTQSEYEDPYEGKQEEDETVFPDSGGYAGLSSSRPAMVEPYPEALAGPPPGVAPLAAEPPEAPPDPVVPTHGGNSSSRANPTSHRPLTRAPGEERSDAPGDEYPNNEYLGGEYPNIAASAEVPLPPEESELDGTTNDSWNSGPAPVTTETDIPSSAYERGGSEPSLSSPGTDPWSPEPSSPSSSVSSPSPGPETWAPQPSFSDADAWSPQEPVREPGGWTSQEPGAWSPQEPVREPGGWTSQEPGAWSPQEPVREPGGWTSQEPVQEPTRGTDDPEAAPRWEDDPLGGVASDGYDDELSPGPRLASRSEPDLGGGLGTGSGNTWAFSRDDPRMPDVVREAEERRRTVAQEGPRYTEWGDRNDERGDGDAGTPVPASEDPLAAIADMQSRARDREQHGDDQPLGEPVDSGFTHLASAAPTEADHVREPGDGGATQMFTPPAFEGEQHTGAVPTGVPSDLGSVPSYGRRGGNHFGDEYGDHREDHGGRGEDQGRHAPTPDVEPDHDDEYDDDFSPADYGMPERPQRGSRRRRSISEDFPGFDDGPLGEDSGDGYPGYDSVDFLADTERGATVTLWLGVASLLPFIGVLAALPALLLTGPRAKRAIRESRGQLDGLGLITVGTVLAVIGIVVTMISVAIAVIG